MAFTCICIVNIFCLIKIRVIEISHREMEIKNGGRDTYKAVASHNSFDKNQFTFPAIFYLHFYGLTHNDPNTTNI